MPQTFNFKRRVEFRDTDMAGIVHFSVFFAYMEQAEHEMLRCLGTNVISEINGEKVSWPRVHASCDYRRAIRYDELVSIDVSVKRIGEKSVTYGFIFERDNERIAEGSITAACCLFQHGGPPQAISVPESFRQILAPFVDESESSTPA